MEQKARNILAKEMPKYDVNTPEGQKTISRIAKSFYEQDVKFAANFGKMMAVGVAGLADLDTDIAQKTADNNFLVAALWVGGMVMSGISIWSAYQDTLRETGDTEKVIASATEAPRHLCDTIPFLNKTMDIGRKCHTVGVDMMDGRILVLVFLC